jgi:hypothetical protein
MYACFLGSPGPDPGARPELARRSVCDDFFLLRSSLRI